MNRIAFSIRALVASISGSRSSRRLLLALFVPAVLAVVLIAGLAPALEGSERIPVAVVNLDEGAAGSNGGTVREGERLVDELTDTDTLTWDVVDEQTADAGLEDGTYALVLKVPADYSEKVMSLEGDDPQKATVELVSTGSENVLATTAGSAVLRQAQARLRASLGEDYLISVLSDVQGKATTLTLTSDGAVMLDEGYDALTQGSDAIAEGLEQTASGADQLGSGLGQIADGVEATGTGTAALGAGLTQIQQQALTPLGEGAETLGEGLDAVADQLVGMGDGVGAMGEQLTALAEQLALDDEDLAALGSLGVSMAEPAESLAGALQTMSDASADALAAAQAVGSSVEGSRDSIDAVQTGADELATSLSSDDAADPGLAQSAAGVAQTAATWADPAMQQQLAQAYAAGEEATAEQLQLIESFTSDMTRLADGTAALSEQASSAAESARGLSEAAGSASDQLAASDDARGRLQDAVDTYEHASEQATSAADDLSDLAVQAVEPASDAVMGIYAAQAALEQMGPALQASGQGVSLLASQLSADGAIGQGVSGIATGIGALDAAMSPVASGADQLAAANTTLAAALDGVASGTSGLGSGLGAMAQATTQLGEGAQQLKEASSQINEATADAAEELSDLADQREDRAEVAASPVSITSTRIHETSSTAAVAAAFAAATLWVGACLTGCLLPACDMRAVAAGSGARSAVAKLATYLVVGVIQAIIVAVVSVAVGVSPSEPIAFAGMLLATGASFALLACALRLICDRWFAWVFAALLVVQLLCAGAVLPVPLSGGIFAALGDVLPIPVVSQALRSLIAGTGRGVDVAWMLLAALSIVAIAVAVACTVARRTVHPERAFSSDVS
ncbi:YhgE/Pip family protein [Collinsella tanakaei]|uniref:YhgE/Pip family protein n=1 Tax=Collinsella tanakaei TaxID=626935 RepID=UPI0025A4945F|nr:YhgE/Pip family protein [Collinsella tanakaei]MDM8301401.1 YhgE/Pip family protein [Collinsella tanakaei]